MELRITNPQESWLTEQILWNNEELKVAIAEKVKDYKTIAYTEDSLKDMKADRADLNKLKKAFEDERKRVKKICMEPYTKFEQQVKEITALIDEPIGLIDSQIREIDERRKAAKREEIEELFASIGFQSFVKLDMIWDEKWLNAMHQQRSTVPPHRITRSCMRTSSKIGICRWQRECSWKEKSL